MVDWELGFKTLSPAQSRLSNWLHKNSIGWSFFLSFFALTFRSDWWTSRKCPELEVPKMLALIDVARLFLEMAINDCFSPKLTWNVPNKVQQKKNRNKKRTRTPHHVKPFPQTSAHAKERSRLSPRPRSHGRRAGVAFMPWDYELWHRMVSILMIDESWSPTNTPLGNLSWVNARKKVPLPSLTLSMRTEAISLIRMSWALLDYQNNSG